MEFCQAEGQRQGDQALLSTVVQVAFEGSALPVSRRDNPAPRFLQLAKLPAVLSVQALVVEGETNRPRDLIEEGTCLERARVIGQVGDGGLPAMQSRQSARGRWR